MASFLKTVVKHHISWLPTQESWLWQSMMATSAGLLLFLAFPRFSFEYAAWVAFAPLLYVITSGISVHRAFWLGWVAGSVFTFFANNWIAHPMIIYGDLSPIIAYAATLFICTIAASFFALFAIVVAQLTKTFGVWSLAAAPAVWVATEWLRPIVTGTTWNSLGVSQYEHYSIARLAQYGGVYLVSWELISMSALVVLIIRAREQTARRGVAVITIFLCLPFLLPLPERMRAEKKSIDQTSLTSTKVTVLGIQPNLEVKEVRGTDRTARGLARLIDLTQRGIERAPDRKADVIVWPETPLPLFYEADSNVRERIDQMSSQMGSYLITNTIARDSGHLFNSVHVISPDPARNDLAPLERYDKMRLVPFGEYVLWRPILGRFISTLAGDFTAGNKAVVNLLKFEAKRENLVVGEENAAPQHQIERETRLVRVGTFICYEVAYPSVVSQFVAQGATLLVNVSNNDWFGSTSGADQHLAHAVMRAIENDRDLICVANSGVTALVTAEGWIVDRLPKLEAGTQIWRAEARGGRTFYTQRGDYFAKSCALFVALLLSGSFLKSLRACRD